MKLISTLAPTFTERAASWISQIDEGNATVSAYVTAFGWTYSNNKANLGF